MILNYIKSPYGHPSALISENTDYWLEVVAATGDYRYFYAEKWSDFEKDLATEISESDFMKQIENMRKPIEWE